MCVSLCLSLSLCVCIFYFTFTLFCVIGIFRLCVLVSYLVVLIHLVIIIINVVVFNIVAAVAIAFSRWRNTYRVVSIYRAKFCQLVCLHSHCTVIAIELMSESNWIFVFTKKICLPITQIDTHTKTYAYCCIA